MAFIVVYDANVLYPNTLRDLLIRIAQLPHIVQAKWTDEILDEMLEALRKNRPDISEEKASRLRERMIAAVRDCLTGLRPLRSVAEPGSAPGWTNLYGVADLTWGRPAIAKETSFTGWFCGTST
jgi:hypothetical protein